MTASAYLAFFFGAVGIIGNAVIFWQNDRERLLSVKLLCDIVWTVHYSLLGAWTGALTCGISILRETVFLTQKRGRAKSRLWPIVFIAINVLFGIASWKNVVNVFPICASVLSVISFAIGKPKLARILQIVISVLFLSYDIYVLSYAGMINELCTLTSVAVALLYFGRKK